MKIEVTSTEREVFVRFNGVTHFRCDRRNITGLSSWIVNRGRVEPSYAIEVYLKEGSNPVLEYDDRAKWEKVLAGIDAVPFLSEFKVQDP